jgi:hypothetical protein
MIKLFLRHEEILKIPNPLKVSYISIIPPGAGKDLIPRPPGRSLFFSISRCLRRCVSLMILFVLVFDCFAQNPFIRHMFTADPSAHVWEDGRLYVYPSHDIAPPRGCDLMDQYHVFSTEDMVNWTDHGEILNSGQVTWGRPEGGFMWIKL